MANALILVFASLGLAGIIFGFLAWRYVSRAAASAPQPLWTRLRLAAVLAGAALTAASYFFVMALGYPVSTPDGPGRIVGWPFIEAYFDSAGNDYVGLITYIGALCNGVFWFLVPQLFLAAYGRRMLTGHVV